VVDVTPRLNEPPFIPSWPGRAPLRYWISPEMEQFRPEINMALLTITREPVWLRFEEIHQPCQIRCIDFRLEPLASGLLGLGMYPPPLIDEPMAGDITLNSDAFSHFEFRPYVLATLIHELVAEALGLGHLYLLRSVRCPHIESGRINLAPEDRASLLTLYGL
jgi:hypothetical protein